MISTGDIPVLMNQSCPIWGTVALVRFVSAGLYTHQLVDPPRAGGRYIIEEPAAIQVAKPSVSEQMKAKLTTMLVNQRMVGIPTPRVAFEHLDEAATRERLSAEDRAQRLLGDLVGRLYKVGEFIPTLSNDGHAFAVSESTDYAEIQYFLTYLEENNWINITSNGSIQITVDGYAKFEK